MQIQLINTSYWVDGEPILDDINLNLQGPALVQVIGPNGAGKTTLLRIMAGLIKPTKGTVRICGAEATGDPTTTGKCIGYVPQRPPISRYNPMTVYDFLSSRALFTRRWPRLREGSNVKGKLYDVLRKTGLTRDILGKRLWELSGGVLMRVFIARTLLHDPLILLLDEPLAPIDPQGKIEFSHLLGEISETRLVIVTSHDPLMLEKYTDTVILLNKRIYAMGPPDEVLRMSVLSQVYGEAIVEVERHIHILDEHGGARK